MKFYGPYVTVCNSPNLLLHLPGRALLRARHDRLRAARARQHAPARRTTASARWAPTSPPTARAPEGTPQYAQNQPYAAAITPDGRADCETGQRGWLERNAGGLDAKYRVNLNPRTPGAQGPTFSRQAARAQGPDVHRRARDQRLPADGALRGGAGDPMRRAKRLQADATTSAWRCSRSRSSCRSSTSASPSRSRSSRSTRSRRRSSPPTTSRRARRCGSPASRSARSRRSSAPAKGSDAVLVTMTIGKAGRPIHDDARAKIRPRIFLEGNFFVDLEPGTPGAPEIADDGDDPDQPDRRAGAVRPGADLAAVRHARGPQDAARRVRQGARQGRRGGLQPLDPVLEERLPRHRDRQRGLAGRDRARPLGLRQERRRDGRGAGPPPRAAQEPDHRLQHDGRRVRPRAGQPAGVDRRAAAHAARRPARARRR